MTDKLNNVFFEQLMSHIMEGVKIPKVQIERAVGPIIGMFIDEVISTTLEEDEILAGEYVTLCPEFPLRKSSNEADPNHSTNIDWLMYNKTKNEIVFLELKTTDTTFKLEQLEVYLAFKKEIEKNGPDFLLTGIKNIRNSSMEHGKYKFITEKLESILKNDSTAFLACKTARIFYLVPEATKTAMEKSRVEIDKIFSFKNLASEIKTPFNNEWQIVHNELKKLDACTRNSRNDQPDLTVRLNYAGNFNFDEMLRRCEESGDLIVIGFLGGITALKAAKLIELKSRLFKHDLAENGGNKNRIPGSKFLEVINQLMAAEPIVNIENKAAGNDRFSLTDIQTQKIDNYFAEQTMMCRQEGEDRPDCASVTFTWIPGFGRSVTAYINGSTQGCEIE